MFVCLAKYILLFRAFQGHTLADSINISHLKLNEAPNFLIIVADDLGWSDVSPLGGEINTPNIQMLADNGTRFTDFHTASACSPTRAMLMSGTDHHIAGLGQMAETMAVFPHIWAGKVGYEGYLNDRVAALPEIMQDAGYFTTMSGKWHLGMTRDRFPASRGFDDSFALLNGGGNHYNYETTFPLPPPVYVRNFQIVNPTTLENFYSSDYFATQLIDSLKTNAETNKKPFFAYLPFTAPHWPLQAPIDLITKYKGMYDDGPDALREKRLEKQRQLGLLSPDVIPSPVYTNAREWSELTPSEQAFSAKTMEIYAAMVESVDLNIGRVIDYLKESNQFENTFVLFISDNGAEGDYLLDSSILSPSYPIQYFNNSYENIGNKDSFISYGPRWAQASTAPSRMNKGYISEGGIRCPAIVHYPKFNKPLNISHEFTTVMDILPTILQLAGIPPPGLIFRNRTVVIPKGKSWVSHLLNSSEHVHPVHSEQDFTGWELFGQQAIRRGNYKAILMPNETNTAEWELYDLTQDKGELVNLAHNQQEVLKELINGWDAYEAEIGVVIAEDGWAVRYPPNVLEVLISITTHGALNTTTPHSETGGVSVITCVNPFLSVCVLLFWLCPYF